MRKRQLDVVIKVSKFCNLRCKYCYEFKELGVKLRMQLDSIDRMYTNILEYLTYADTRDSISTDINFIWHGGEPFLIPIDYYKSTITRQQSILGDQFTCNNLLQTNLTVLNDDICDFIKDYNIKLGVSFDVIGDLRVNLANRDSTSRVVKNLDLLRAAEIDFACIVVLSKENIQFPDEIFNFFKSTNTPFRVLPLFEGAYENQNIDFDITTQEIDRFLSRLNELSFQNQHALRIDPLSRINVIADKFTSGERNKFYNKIKFQSVLMVNTNGDCQGYGDPYLDSNYIYGNIFEDSLFDIFNSSQFYRSVGESNVRVASNCVNCKFFGYCDGYPSAEAPIDARTKNEQNVHTCVVTKSLITKALSLKLNYG